jgi:predicted O-methyltransferase YrrM
VLPWLLVREPRLARAFVQANHLSPEETVWAAKIEARREALLTSGETINTTDYSDVTADKEFETEGIFFRATPVAEVLDRVASSPVTSRLLFALTRQFKPTRCLELGTFLGLSGAYIAAAMQLNGGGELVTVEGAPEVAQIARETFAAVGLDNVEVVTGLFDDVLDAVLAGRTYEMVFIDGHHDREATLRYDRRIAPHFSGLAVYDDIYWSAGMTEAWQQVRCDRRFRVAVSRGQLGLAVTFD